MRLFSFLIAHWNRPCFWSKVPLWIVLYFFIIALDLLIFPWGRSRNPWWVIFTFINNDVFIIAFKLWTLFDFGCLLKNFLCHAGHFETLFDFVSCYLYFRWHYEYKENGAKKYLIEGCQRIRNEAANLLDKPSIS